MQVYCFFYLSTRVLTSAVPSFTLRQSLKLHVNAKHMRLQLYIYGEPDWSCFSCIMSLARHKQTHNTIFQRIDS